MMMGRFSLAVFLILSCWCSVEADAFGATPSLLLRPKLYASTTEPSKEGAGRRARKKHINKEEYELRRNMWMDKYASLEALQKTFGAAPSLWGDLTPEQTRRLYHTLLPRSLLALHEMGLMKPQELAPLAYEARIAAKQYARSRCTFPARIGTAAFDVYRNLRNRGRLGGPSSMTWQEIYKKYEVQIVQEECALNNSNTKDDESKKTSSCVIPEKDLTMRIYLRILEKSCVTNQAFDNLFLKQNDVMDDTTSKHFAEIAQTLDHDVREILLRPKDCEKAMKKAEKAEKKAEKVEKKRLKAERKEEKKQQKIEEKKKRKRRLEETSEKEEEEELMETTATNSNEAAVTIDSQRYEKLRILAGTRAKFRLLMKRNKA
jgi:hypothetical protein